MGHIARHLAGLVVLLAAFDGAGTGIQRLVPALRAEGAYRGFVRLTLGITVWIAALFSLASVRWLRPTIVLPMLGAAVAVSALSAATGCVDVVRRSSRGNRWRERGSISLRSAFDAGVAMAGPAAVLVALFLLALRADVVSDDATYHLTLPKIYLAHGGFRPVRFNLYATWPLNIELLFSLGMLAYDYIVAKILHTTFLVFLVVVVYDATRTSSSVLAAALAVTLLLANPILLGEAQYAYVDIAYAFIFLLAFVLANRYVEGERRSLLFAGICCGLLAGIKLTGLLAVLCIAALLLAARPRPAPVGATLRDIVMYLGVPTAVLVTPWLIRSWWYTGNPVYPFLYEWFGGVDWSEELSRQFADWHASIGMGRSFTDYLLLPFRVAVEGGNGYAHFDGRINPLWIVLVPTSVVFARSNPLARRALGVSGIYFVLWALSSQQARFLIPILPLLALAAGIALTDIGDSVAAWLDRFFEESSTRRIVRGSIAAILVGCAALALMWEARFTVRKAIQTGEAMIAGDAGTPGDAIAPIYRYINENVPPSGKLMLLNTNLGFFIDREYIADSTFGASQMNTILTGPGGAAGIHQRLRDLGVTHVLFWRIDFGVPYPPSLWDFFADRRFSEKIYSSPEASSVLFKVS